MSHACHRFWKCYKTLMVLLTFGKVHNPFRLPRKTTLQGPKVARACGTFHILTSKCASRHNGVHFFIISTSKSGPSMVFFAHFDLEMCYPPQRRALFIISTSKNAPNVRCFYLFHWQMCFAPQWCALFRHLNFQKWSGPGVFCTF